MGAGHDGEPADGAKSAARPLPHDGTLRDHTDPEITATVTPLRSETMTRAHRENPTHLHRLAKFTFRRMSTARARREIERADNLFAVLDRVNRLARIAGSDVPPLPTSLVRR